jgi:hypothetical protein
MNEKSLKRGNELETEMRVIRAALKDLKTPPKKGEREAYWLYLSAHKDGSGPFCDLIGANVAIDVLDAVYAELQNQLAQREEEFAAL